MKLIDTHAHIYEKTLANNIDTVIAESKQVGITKILMPNIDHNTIDPLLAVADRYPDLCLPMIGLHPCHVKKDFHVALCAIDTWLKKRKFIGIGEIGLDLHHDTTYQALQEEVFILQLEWARKYHLPVVIHSRAALATTIRILAREQDGTLKGIIHCFDGTLREAQQLIGLGFHLGIGGIITFKNSSLATVVSKIDLAHIVVETDSPYLAPEPYRGERNKPSYLPYIVAAIANSQQVTQTAVAVATTENAKNIFNIK